MRCTYPNRQAGSWTCLAELHWQGSPVRVAYGVVEERDIDADIPRLTGHADVPHKHHWLCRVCLPVSTSRLRTQHMCEHKVHRTLLLCTVQTGN